MPTTLKTTKAAPKKVAAKLVTPKKAASTASKPLTTEELRAAFAAYTPELVVPTQVLNVKEDNYEYHIHKKSWKQSQACFPSPKWTTNGVISVPRYDARQLVIDLKTVKAGANKKPEVLPFWFQVEQGLHPVLPKVPDFPKFLTEWAKDLSKGEKTTTSVYTGHHQFAIQAYRFCEQELKKIQIPPEVQKYVPALSCYGNYYYKARFTEALNLLTNTNVSGKMLDTRAVPKATPKQIDVYVNEATKYQSSFVVELPSALEFQDNSEMLKRVEEHCKIIPGFKVHYVRRMMGAYTSDGQMAAHPTAFNEGGKKLWMNKGAKDPLKSLIVKSSSPGAEYQAITANTIPVMYCGPIWAVSFSMLDNYVCNGNMVYFVEWEEFVKAYTEYRPDLLVNLPQFTDLVFLMSHWCERNSARNYNKGIELQTPVDRQLSLRNWIMGPFVEYVLRGTKLPGVSSYSGALTMKKLQIIEETNKSTPVEARPRLAPVWAKHMETLNGPTKEPVVRRVTISKKKAAAVIEGDEG